MPARSKGDPEKKKKRRRTGHCGDALPSLERWVMSDFGV